MSFHTLAPCLPGLHCQAEGMEEQIQGSPRYTPSGQVGISITQGENETHAATSAPTWLGRSAAIGEHLQGALHPALWPWDLNALRAAYSLGVAYVPALPPVALLSRGLLSQAKLWPLVYKGSCPLRAPLPPCGGG